MLDTIKAPRSQAWRSNIGAFSGKAAKAELPDIPPPPLTPVQSGWSTPRGNPRGEGPHFTLGAATITSTGKGTSENQDAHVMTESHTGSKCLVGVFDGHGELGHVVSGFASKALPSLLFSHDGLHDRPKAAMEDAYDATQRQLEQELFQESTQSGCTAVVAYLHRNRLIVGNAGDSRAVLGVRSDAAVGSRPTSNSATLRAVELSQDHKPSRPDERLRVQAAGGTVTQSRIPVATADGIRMVKLGPERVMDKTGSVGLAVSRSFGDLNLRPYITSKPEITDRRLGPNDQVIILGSDGVWDHISSQEAVDIAGQIGDPGVAARTIADVARRRWRHVTKGAMSDDITAVVVSLDHDGDSSTSTPRMPRGRPSGPGQQRFDWTLPSLPKATAPVAYDGASLFSTVGGRSRSSRPAAFAAAAPVADGGVKEFSQQRPTPLAGSRQAADAQAQGGIPELLRRTAANAPGSSRQAATPLVAPAADGGVLPSPHAGSRQAADAWAQGRVPELLRRTAAANAAGGPRQAATPAADGGIKDLLAHTIAGPLGSSRQAAAQPAQSRIGELLRRNPSNPFGGPGQAAVSDDGGGAEDLYGRSAGNLVGGRTSRPPAAPAAFDGGSKDSFRHTSGGRRPGAYGGTDQPRNTGGSRIGNARRGLPGPGQSQSQPAARRATGAAASRTSPLQLPAAGTRSRRNSQT